MKWYQKGFAVEYDPSSKLTCKASQRQVVGKCSKLEQNSAGTHVELNESLLTGSGNGLSNKVSYWGGVNLKLGRTDLSTHAMVETHVTSRRADVGAMDSRAKRKLWWFIR